MASARKPAVASSSYVITQADVLGLPAIYEGTLTALYEKHIVQRSTQGHADAKSYMTYRQFKHALLSIRSARSTNKAESASRSDTAAPAVTGEPALATPSRSRRSDRLPSTHRKEKS